MQNTSSDSPSDEPYRVPEYKVTRCSTCSIFVYSVHGITCYMLQFP